MADAHKPESASAIAARVGLPVLFVCQPYGGVRLTETACAKRYRSACADPKHTRFRECIGCATGAKHAAAHPDAIPAPKRKGKRRGDVMEVAIAEAMAKKDAARRAKATPSSDTSPPSSSRPASTAPTVEAPVSAPAAIMGALAAEGPAPSTVERRPRGAPPPRAGDEAERFRQRLRTDEAERARVLALLDGVAFGTPAAHRAARACALRRVAGLPLSAVVEALGDVDEAGAAVLVSRGRWVIARGLRQHRLDEGPDERAALDAIAPLVRELVRAERVDAGRPRPNARGPRKAVEPRPLPMLEALERGAA